MSNKKVEKLLTNLHLIIGEELLNRVVSGEASTGDLVAAIRFLKDNGISATLESSEPLRNLAETVPFKIVEDIREVN